MFKPVGKGAFIFYLRMWALPMALAAIYLLQQEFPSIHRHCALWSEHLRWWQFFTCSFLSHDLGHLAVNAGGLAIVYSQFAPQVRGPVLAAAFCLFATISNLVFFEWLMPRPAWLIGASGGSYALLGFFSWFLRRAYFCVYKCTWLKFRIIPVLVISIAGEYLYVRWRMPAPVLAWQMHAIGFVLGLSSAAAIHAVYAASRAVAARCPGQGMAQRLGASVHEAIFRVRQFAEISGKPGVAEEAV